MIRFATLGLLFATATIGLAAESLPLSAKVVRLDVSPATLELTGPFSYGQFVVSAVLDTGEAVDVTRLAEIKAPAVAKLASGGLVRPVADGSGELTVSLGGQSAKVPVTVKELKGATPVSFVRDVQPVLSKLGCNQGTCHGAAQGKNGFKLSLRGYDPIYDHRALTDDLEGRRFNRAAPERSLMLMKPAGGIPHTGGVLWQADEPNYELVRRWIAEGVKLDSATTKVASIELLPKSIVVPTIGQKQQFRVVAKYLDGSMRDVTAEAFIDSSNTEVATIDKSGLLSSVRRGETTMLARYEGAYAAAGVVVMGDRTGFEWKPQPSYGAIDDLVDAKLKRMKINASGLCTDEEFLRRVMLDLTGLPPTSDEVRAFLADPKPSREKRDAKIDVLIGSPGYVEHWTNKWADLLQVNRKFLGDAGATKLREWIKNAIEKNVPYDQFAFDILTASGSNLDNPAASYYKVLREADAAMENTSQLFLAIRFNCNKCHDHPFEKWTQDQYFQTAAYFAQVTRNEDPKYAGQRIGGTDVEGAKPLVEIIGNAKGGEIKHDRTGQNAVPKFPFSHAGAKIDEKAPRREQLAKWVTAKENPYFAKSYANRLWSYLTGVGVIEPVDDIRASNPPTNPELLEKLTSDFVAGGFDTRKLIAAICKSRTYQLSIGTNPFNRDDDINYSHAQPRRLPAEVLFDAIHRAVGAQSRLAGMPAGARAAQLLDSNVELPGAFLELFGKPVRESACECERSSSMTLGPVLAMVNGPIVGDAIRDPSNRIVTFTEGEKDDAKVVEEVYLGVLGRRPTAKEVEIGKKAIAECATDYAALAKEYGKYKSAFDDYSKSIDAKMPAYEEKLKAQRPTTWSVAKPKTIESKAGEAADKLSKSSTVKQLDDGSVLVTGTTEKIDIYTLSFEAKADKPITGLRLEVLPDDALPAKGPGRAQNGNFVLHELKVTTKVDGKDVAAKLKDPQADFSQDSFPVQNVIDGNLGTGWAVAPQLGQGHIAVFAFDKPIDAAKATAIGLVLDQRFGTGHTIGKFRISFTSDDKPKLKAGTASDVLAILDMPKEKRTSDQQGRIRAMYEAQDGEFHRLRAAIPVAPPKDARAIGAQDLAWALMNTPAFLFNR